MSGTSWPCSGLPCGNLRLNDQPASSGRDFRLSGVLQLSSLLADCQPCRPASARWPRRCAPPLPRSPDLQPGRNSSSCSAACGRACARRQARGCLAARRGWQTRDAGHADVLDSALLRTAYQMRTAYPRGRSRESGRLGSAGEGKPRRSPIVLVAPGWRGRSGPLPRATRNQERFCSMRKPLLRRPRSPGLSGGVADWRRRGPADCPRAWTGRPCELSARPAARARLNALVVA